MIGGFILGNRATRPKNCEKFKQIVVFLAGSAKGNVSHVIKWTQYFHNLNFLRQHIDLHDILGFVGMTMKGARSSTMGNVMMEVPIPSSTITGKRAATMVNLTSKID